MSVIVFLRLHRKKKKKMNSINLNKFLEVISWLIALYFMGIGFGYIKKIIGFLLMKFYESFIQHQ